MSMWSGRGLHQGVGVDVRDDEDIFGEGEFLEDLGEGVRHGFGGGGSEHDLEAELTSGFDEG